MMVFFSFQTLRSLHLTFQNDFLATEHFDGGRGVWDVQDEVQVLFHNKTSLIPSADNKALFLFKTLIFKCFFFVLFWFLTRLDFHFAKAHPAEGVSVARDRQHCLVELWDLPVDQGLQGLLEPVVVALQLPLIFLLVRPDQALVLPQGILTPFGEVLEAEAEFVVVSEELWIVGDFRQENLCNF